MNQKKCPKCGESNPVEGVMCWACYTPLSGGASAGAKAPMSAPPAAIDEKEKPKITPVQMGVLGVGLLVVLGMGWKSISGGSVDDVPDGLPPIPGSTKGGEPPFVPPRPVTPGGSAPAPQVGGVIPTDPGNSMAYVVTTPPGRSTWATIGIVPSVPNTDGVTAGRLASLAHKPFAKSGRYQGIYVYAFADKQSAAVFQKFQQNRRGAPLEPGDYEDQTLRTIWPKTLARYEYFKGQEAIRYPQANPDGWYQGTSTWTTAAR